MMHCILLTLFLNANNIWHNVSMLEADKLVHVRVHCDPSGAMPRTLGSEGDTTEARLGFSWAKHFDRSDHDFSVTVK